MRLIFLFLLLLCLYGCGTDSVSSIDPGFLIGTWSGTSTATYPGPDDAPITSEEPIKFVFTDSNFQYFRLAEGGSETVAYGSGDYTTSDSSVTLSNVIRQGFYEPMNLQGEFIFGLINNTLSFVQNENPGEFFLTYHLVILEKEEIVLQ